MGQTHYTSGKMGKGHEGFNETLRKIQSGDPTLLKGSSGMGPSQSIETLHLKKAQRKPTTKNLPTSYKGTTATG